MEGMNRVLIVGVRGRLGAPSRGGKPIFRHPTYALVRATTLTSSPEKSRLLQSLVSSGLQLVQGSMEDYPVVVEVIKQLDVVISTQVMDQKNIIRSIKEAGCFKEVDVAAFAIKAMDDTKTLNKTVYLTPPGNIYSFNEFIQLWEAKIGKTLQKTCARRAGSEDNKRVLVQATSRWCLYTQHL